MVDMRFTPIPGFAGTSPASGGRGRFFLKRNASPPPPAGEVSAKRMEGVGNG